MSATAPSQEAIYAPSNDVGLRELWQAIRAKRLLLLACVAVCTLGGIAVALIMKPVYRAEVVVMPVKSATSGGQLGEIVSQLGGGLGSIAGGLLGRSGGTDKEASIAILSSRGFTRAFIEDKNLMPVLYAKQWDAQRRAWRQADKRKQPTINDAIRRFDKSILTVAEDRRSGMVRLTIDWRDPAEAAAWANELVERLNATARRQAIEDAERSLEFLRGEQAKTDVVSLHQAIAKLMEGQMEAIMMANVKREYAFKVIDPAVAPDADDYVRPRRALIVAGALFVGLMLGVVAALISSAMSREGR